MHGSGCLKTFSANWRKLIMTKVKDIFEYLNKLAPVSLKEDFDNVGLLVGDGEAPVSKIMVALDITDEVIDEAVSFGAELIVSHHPIIFDPMKTVLCSDLSGKKIYKLIKNDISAICMHTNLDIAAGGVNDELISVLGASSDGFLDYTATDADGNMHGCGRVGELENEMCLNDFLLVCKQKLNSNGLRYHDAGLKVKKLAVMGGSGGGCVETAKQMGCDTYVTADIKYNQFLDAKELGINLIDADHFCTENVIIPVLKDKICNEFPDCEIAISAKHAQTAQFF